MALSVADFIKQFRTSRRHFLRHLEGLTPDQLDWKASPRNLSVRETLAHMIMNERAALESLQTGSEPNYERHQTKETDLDRLIGQLSKSHEALISFVEEEYGNEGPDTLGFAWGGAMPIHSAIALFSSEDYYHSGQVGYIRIATDPSYDYVAHIYGS